jgi:putative nucleotidyltransferase with HDIG domain
MGGLPRATLVRTYLTVIATAAVCLWALGSEPSLSGRDLLIALLLGGILAISESKILDIAFPNGTGTLHVSVGSPIAFAAGLTLGPVTGAVVSMLAILIESVADRRQPIKILVNVTIFGLVTVLSALTYRALADGDLSPLGNLRNMAAVAVASVVFNLVNLSVISSIVAPVMGLTPINMLRTNLSGFYVQMLTLPTFGAIVPVIAQEHVAALLVIVIPLIGPLLAFRGFERTRLSIQETMAGLADALERRDPYTHEHSMRVTEYVGKVLSQLALPYETTQGILAAARIHDIGKVAIPDDVLNKPGSLTKDEFIRIQSHAAVGAEMVEKLWMYRPWVPVIHHHHERWDGNGYPAGLAGEEIPLGARIIAVADAYDAMTTDRVYRKAFPVEKALKELRDQRGIQFDPEIVDALCRAFGLPDDDEPGTPVTPAPPTPPTIPTQHAAAASAPSEQQPAAMVMQPPVIAPQG